MATNSSKLVRVQVKVLDQNDVLMSGFPIIRGPKNGRMAPEAYTDKNGVLEFQASPNREIELKLLSPNDLFDGLFYCNSGEVLKLYTVKLNYSREQYLSKTKILWLSKYSKQKIPHSSFQIKYLNSTGLIKAETGEAEITSIIGEAVELRYVFADGATLSDKVVYMSKRVNPNPLSIEIDQYINATLTDINQPVTPDTVQSEPSNCTAKFHKISKIVLAHEGGYVNDPNDSGGATNKGIAWATWTQYAQADLGVAPTLANLKSITDDQAEIIYRKRYWEPKGFCRINDDRVGLMAYDWTITSGGAAKEMQKLLINNFHQKIQLDGAMGVETIEAMNAIADQSALLNAITQIRQQYYTALAYTANGAQSKNHKFLKGWLNRVDDCLQVAL